MAEQTVGDLPELLNVKQVAAYLQLHEVTVLNFARQGKLPGFKVGRAWRFRADDIRAWLEAQRGERERFRERFDVLWARLGEKMRASGYDVEDVPRLIEEVREERRKRQAPAGE